SIGTELSAFLPHPSHFSEDHLSMGPDIPFRMPFGVLNAVRHRPTPRLGFRPGRDVLQRRVFELVPVHEIPSERIALHVRLIRGPTASCFLMACIQSRCTSPSM